jgi:predicted ester cyclase
MEKHMSNTELALALHEIWNTGDLTRIDEVYHEAYVGHWPASSEIPERAGREGVRRGIQRIRRAFPDWHEAVDDIFGADDRVCVRYTSTGTHAGPFWGLAPTGRSARMQEMSIYRIAEDRIIEQWCMFDELARLQQLGVSERRLLQLIGA